MRIVNIRRKRIIAICFSVFLLTLFAVPCFASSTTADTATTWYLNGDVVIRYGKVIPLVTFDSPVSFKKSNNSNWNNSLTGFNSTSSQIGLYFGNPPSMNDSMSSGYIVLRFDDYPVSPDVDWVDLSDPLTTVEPYSYTPPAPVYQAVPSTVVGGFNGLISSLGSGVADLFGGLFLDEDDGISVFGTVSLVFIGVAVAVGIGKMLIHKV